MTLLFIDGFDHYDISSIDEKWNEYSGNYTTPGSNYARFSGKGCQIYGDNGNLLKDIGVDKSTLYFGGAFRKVTGGSPIYSSNSPFIQFKDENQVVQVRIYAMSSYGFDVRQGDGTLLGSTAGSVYVSSKWYYIEVKVTISATVGVVEIKLNGTQVLNLTSQDTKNGTDYIRFCGFQGMRSGIYVDWDDIYIDDAQFHGDCRIRTFMPDADGNSADFTRSTGSNDYECVDENPPNEDTDYIVSDTLNHKSIFGITTGALGTVEAIQLNNHCRLDEAGTRKITPIIRSNSTDYSGTETDVITATYQFEHEIWETDPDDSGAWDQTKLEAAEFGLEITT